MLITCLLALLTLLAPPALAETKIIISEATYIMGDAENPFFAEAMVLQKAKQRALEEAGTYVESYTHIRNFELTVDEIKTIAGGVMKTEVVEQNRALEGNGFRFYIKIRSLVTTDNLEDLARRIRGGTLVEENKKLRDAMTKLNKDLDLLKRQVAETKTEPERVVVLDKIREVEKQFLEVLSTERAFYKRLVSGEDLSAKAEREFQNEKREREELQRRQERRDHAFEQLLRIIRDNGHTIEIDPPETTISLDKPEVVTLVVGVTATVTEEAKAAIQELHQVCADELVTLNPKQIDRIEQVLKTLTLMVTVTLKDGSQYAGKQNGFHNFRSLRSYDPKTLRYYDLETMAEEGSRTRDLRIDIPRRLLGEVISIEGRIS